MEAGTGLSRVTLDVELPEALWTAFHAQPEQALHLHIGELTMRQGVLQQTRRILYAEALNRDAAGLERPVLRVWTAPKEETDGKQHDGDDGR